MHTTLAVKRQWTRSHGRNMRTWEDNIKTIFREIMCEVAEWL